MKKRTKRRQASPNDEIVGKVQAALFAIQAVEADLEDGDGNDELLDSVGLAAEGMETLACQLGFGVINGVIVSR